jgi:HSP20 family protein
LTEKEANPSSGKKATQPKKRKEINMNNNNGMTLWRDAFSPVSEFRREFDRLFDDWLAPSTHGLRTESHFVPACEVEEQDDHYLLAVEMAGVRKDDIKMEAFDNQIVISGERRNETHRKEEGRTYSERRYGKFQRTFALPTGVDVSQVEANYQDGILRIVVPKAETAKPKQIKISDGNSGSKFFSQFLGLQPRKLEGKEERQSPRHSDKVAS